ncbi:hypothetical protein PoB_004588600 [Plakobranchus ocellatus]|uniref:Uncharacterized protein n=1 Tax=Plakobranchus ocellatus TaxID=259542 RepID=A0AAV4BK81_9GAST|nr:hypothetical protein PoB_004588600 [Plakobranchus ocellatus]
MNDTTATSASDPLMTSTYPPCVKAAGNGAAMVHSKRNNLMDADSDIGALVYIVVVLVFYSAGVMIMIVRYLKTEKKELEEEATLENFFKYMPDKRQEQEHRVNQVAIHAFHTLTSFSYDDDELDDLDLGSDNEDTPSVEPLIVTAL